MARRIEIGKGRPVPEWINVLKQAESAEERYHALTQIMISGEPSEASQWSRFALDDDDPIMRGLGAKQLGRLKARAGDSGNDFDWSEAANRLSELLSDEDIDVQFEAARALGRIHPETTAARDVLLSLLTNEEALPLMQAAIVAAITERKDISPRTLLERYRELIAHPQGDIRENVATAISLWNDGIQEVINELVVALDDEEPVVRESAAVALGKAGTSTMEIIEALQNASSDEDEGVANAAKQSLSLLRQN